MAEKLFYKGKEIKSEEAHALDPKEKAFLTSRKPVLEKPSPAKEIKKEKKK